MTIGSVKGCLKQKKRSAASHVLTVSKSVSFHRYGLAVISFLILGGETVLALAEIAPSFES